VDAPIPDKEKEIIHYLAYLGWGVEVGGRRCIHVNKLLYKNFFCEIKVFVVCEIWIFLAFFFMQAALILLITMLQQLFFIPDYGCARRKIQHVHNQL
jgi:hypothetical protein